jgi:hypothetical protein
VSRPAALAALLVAVSASACASAEGHRTVTPRVQVVVKGESRKPAVADYRAAPDASKLAGSGGSAR